MSDYIRRVNYYETDKMGITHHSNYIRWMEEARTTFLNQLGYGYGKLETYGITSPVIAVECSYKRPTTFDDEVNINTTVEEYNGVRLTIKYIITNNATGAIVLIGKTSHCFIDKESKPIILKKRFPEFDAILKNLAMG